MNVFKIFLCDLKEGIIKNKRNLIIPFLCILQCLYANLQINTYKEYYNIKDRTTFLDLFTEIFRGCDPISKNQNPDIKIMIPYLWFSIFAFSVFINFDYMHNDLTQFGMQIIARTKKRCSWWISKCLWSITSSLWFYLIFITVTAVFSAVNRFTFIATNNTETINLIADGSVIYQYDGFEKWTISNMISIIICPMITICALNMMQLFFSLFIKPMYGYLAIIGFLSFGIITDSPIAFTRLSMVIFSDLFYHSAYNRTVGIICSICLIIFCTLFGLLYFRKYDIIPDKDKE